MLIEYRFNEKSKLWFSSDFHANHKQPFVWRDRGFESAEEHTQYIISKVNTLVGENDILFHCGDLTLNTTDEMFWDFIRSLKCQNIYCLPGNHTNPLTRIYRNEVRKQFGEAIKETYPFRIENLLILPQHFEFWVGSQYIVLNHYPLVDWNRMKDGSFMLHGHCHGQYTKSDVAANDGKILDVGFDNFLHPVSYSELEEIMAKKQVSSVGHH